MERELTVLLLEDEQSECFEIIRYADTVKDVVLVGVTSDTKQALECVCNHSPDAVILDLELHKGSGNGLIFLRELKNIELRSLPYILVTTNNISPVTHEQARTLGADFIMAKCQSDYSAASVIEFLRSIKSTLHSKVRLQGLSHDLMTTEVEVVREKRIVQKISGELDRVGISPKAIGKKYLIDAIHQIMIKPGSHISAAIAPKYGKSDASVERAMQNAIISAWRTNSIESLLANYTAPIRAERGVPTITEFIYYYAEKMRNDY